MEELFQAYFVRIFRRTVRIAAFAFVLSTGLSTQLLADTPAVNITAPTLVRVVRPGELDPPSYIGPGAEYNYGSVNPIASPFLIHDFLLSNISGKPVQIITLAPTCECTTGDILGPNGKPAALPYTVAPGAEVAIRLKVNMSETQPGVMQKGIKVISTTDNAATSPVILQVDGMIVPQVEFSPSVLDFGQQTSGTTKTLPLVVSVHLSAHSSVSTVKLISSDPAVLLSLAADGGSAEQTIALKSSPVSATVYVSVTSAAAVGGHYGFITAQLVSTNKSAEQSFANPPTAGMEDFRSLVVAQASYASPKVNVTLRSFRLATKTAYSGHSHVKFHGTGISG